MASNKYLGIGLDITDAVFHNAELLLTTTQDDYMRLVDFCTAFHDPPPIVRHSGDELADFFIKCFEIPLIRPSGIEDTETTIEKSMLLYQKHKTIVPLLKQLQLNVRNIIDNELLIRQKAIIMGTATNNGYKHCYDELYDNTQDQYTVSLLYEETKILHSNLLEKWGFDTSDDTHGLVPLEDLPQLLSYYKIAVSTIARVIQDTNPEDLNGKLAGITDDKLKTMYNTTFTKFDSLLESGFWTFQNYRAILFLGQLLHKQMGRITMEEFNSTIRQVYVILEQQFQLSAGAESDTFNRTWLQQLQLNPKILQQTLTQLSNQEFKGSEVEHYIDAIQGKLPGIFYYGAEYLMITLGRKFDAYTSTPLTTIKQMSNLFLTHACLMSGEKVNNPLKSSVLAASIVEKFNKQLQANNAEEMYNFGTWCNALAKNRLQILKKELQTNESFRLDIQQLQQQAQTAEEQLATREADLLAELEAATQREQQLQQQAQTAEEQLATREADLLAELEAATQREQQLQLSQVDQLSTTNIEVAQKLAEQDRIHSSQIVEEQQKFDEATYKHRRDMHIETQIQGEILSRFDQSRKELSNVIESNKEQAKLLSTVIENASWINSSIALGHNKESLENAINLEHGVNPELLEPNPELLEPIDIERMRETLERETLER